MAASFFRRPGAFCVMASLSLFVVWTIIASVAFATEEIMLREAVDTALAGHPRLAAFAFEQQAADGRTLQSSKSPNPELDFELANTGGNYPLIGRSETTVTYSQPIELQKKAVRIRRSEAENALLGRDQQSVRLNVIAEVMRAFVTLQGAQNKRVLTREAEMLAMSLKNVASERVAAGALSPIEATRANVAFSLAVTDVARAERGVEAARRELSAAIGEPNLSFVSAAGTLPENLAIPDPEALFSRLDGNPDLARWDTERALRQAALDVEKSLARPDVTLRGGVKYQREDSQLSFLAGFTVPLTINNRNEGAIREAQAKLSATDLARREAEIRLRGQLGVRHAAMTAAAREAATLKGESLAGAQSAYDAVNEGYRLGKFRYLDVLDAGKMLLETRMRYVDAIVELNLARVDVERLVAQDRSK